MGGHALKTLETRRYKREEYLILQNIVEQKLKSVFEDVYITESFKTKEDFGDMDCIVDSPKRNPVGLWNSYQDAEDEKSQKNWVESVLKILFEPDEIFKNDDVYSINYGVDGKKDFQIDLIFCYQYFKTSKFYMKAGDLGNLMGRIAYSLGLELGHKLGLTVRYETKPNYHLKPIILTDDPETILTYLGLDPEIFFKGFETEKEIFDYAISSSKFAGYLYKWENLNNENRTRNRKRPFYQNFVNYITGTGDIELNKSGLDILNTSFQELKKFKLKAISDFGKQNELHELLGKERIQDYLRTRFNGEMAQNISGLPKGKELGSFIKSFKNSFGTEINFENFLLDSENNIEEKLREFLGLC